MRIAAMAKRKMRVGESMRRDAKLFALIAAAAFCVAVVFAAGCGAARPVKYYQLTIPGDMTTQTDANAYPITLLVGPLTGSHLYRDDRIVYSSGETMGTYDTQRWS